MGATEVRPDELHDAARRYGSRINVKLDCERGLPPISASGEQLAAYHRRMLGEDS